MDENPIVVDRRPGYRVITLNRPERLNAFNEAMQQALAAAIADAERDESCRALLLTGAGRAFSSGQDLNERVTATGDVIVPGEALERYYNPLVRKLRALRFPVVAAVNGIAAGAACNIALACDIVLAARSAFFLQAFARIGLIPDSGGTWSLPRLVGDARARGLAMLAERLPAEQAAAWGLIWQCVDDDKLMDEARALARRLAAQPTRGLALMKQALNAAATNTLDRQLDLERDLQRIAGRTEDYREGVAAFLEKRAPRFLGR